ncbi:protein-export chaperone SecB [Neorickettsia helminthoeca str. Oregon]|uniref:Protein-export protein SecB n=1 Tax=Neorickettsia helminthoeca str. Oregon TaxID=1286528 RepID=X5H3M6_9RICK|nr:protein-export chaperone SecB [Neorickettsia helminthoeca]AHX11298.1 protein-export chaperone SecB [Neorickettsia helminthoeca str. Oregon]
MLNEENINNYDSSSVDNSSDNNEADLPMARPEGQFMKSISLDTPNSPEVFSIMKNPPEVDVQCNIDSRIIDEQNGIYEVLLDIKTEARISDENSPDGKHIAFVCKLKYCGVFTIRNLTQDQLKQALLVEAPTLLFPFARRIIATATTDAGFPPLMLAPINFAQKYTESQKD